MREKAERNKPLLIVRQKHFLLVFCCCDRLSWESKFRSKWMFYIWVSLWEFVGLILKALNCMLFPSSVSHWALLCTQNIVILIGTVTVPRITNSSKRHSVSSIQIFLPWGDIVLPMHELIGVLGMSTCIIFVVYSVKQSSCIHVCGSLP